MDKIKNLMFDLGGVIMDIQRENAVAALEKTGLADADNLLGKYGQKGIFLQLEMGLVTPDEFRAELRKHIDRPVSDREIDYAFEKFLIGIPVERLRQLEKLREKYRIYLLSNTNAIMWHDFIAESFKADGHDIDHYFDDTITSFEVHAYKPDAEIFRIAMRKFDIKPEETIFLDDSMENVEASKKLGFKGVHVTGDKSFEEYIDYITK